MILLQNVDNSKDEDVSEDEAEISAGITDTMLTATDFLMIVKCNKFRI